jgi:hypothetical protein
MNIKEIFYRIIDDDKAFRQMVAVLLVALVIVLALLFTSPPSQKEQAIPNANLASTKLLIKGDGKDYLPAVNELPAGFVLMEDESLPIYNSTVDGYQLLFTNPNYLTENREVNVRLMGLVFHNQDLAIQAYLRLSDPETYVAPGSTTEVDNAAGQALSGVDSFSLLFGTDPPGDSPYPTLIYTLSFCYTNFVGEVIVSGPIDNFNSPNALLLRERLKQAAFNYAFLIKKKLPISAISSSPLISLPPTYTPFPTSTVVKISYPTPTPFTPWIPTKAHILLP